MTPNHALQMSNRLSNSKKGSSVPMETDISIDRSG
jgi:hypothetical protein